MKRFLTFTALFPPLALAVYTMADGLWGEGLPGIGFLAYLLAIAFALSIVPAWLMAGVDLVLSSKPIYLRIVVSMAVGAILAELVARYMGQPSIDVQVAVTGAIPAAICSWLSSRVAA